MTRLIASGFILAVSLVSAFSLVNAQTNARPESYGRSICTPYDPATITIAETRGIWELRRSDDAILRLFANLEDAEAGLSVAREYNQYCHIGRASAQKTGNPRFLMEYWQKK